MDAPISKEGASLHSFEKQYWVDINCMRRYCVDQGFSALTLSTHWSG